MKFVYLCADQGIPILGTKGASVHVREFASALMDLGHTVTLVCAKRGQGNEAGGLSITEIAPQVDYPRLRAQIQSPPISKGTIQNANQLLDTELKKLAYNLQLLPALEHIIADVQPNVLYERYSLFSYAGSVVARKHHLPHLLEVNAPLIRERQASTGLALIDLAQTIEDQVFRQADAVITVSATLKDYAIERGVRRNRVTAIPNGVDLSKFNPTVGNEGVEAEGLQALGIPADLRRGTVIGFVGSLKPWHGVDILIRALARARQIAPRLRLLIVGEGPQLEHLQSEVRARSLSDCVYFTGAVPHSLIPKYIALMDITVAPYRQQSHFYFSPLKILEYMAMGKSVVATRQGQISELIEHERNGLLCEAESAESLANNLIRLANDPDLRHRLGRCAAATVANHHSWLNVAGRVIDVADDVLSTFGSGLTEVVAGASARTQPGSGL